jgi:hypothetical protein
MQNILFESNTEVPTEFEYNGETIINFGDVKIIEGNLFDEAPSL